MNPHQKRTQLGVSLLEVLIALLVIAVGVLGLSKMQALSISNASVSGSRGLIALQASSLSSILHGNKLYWQSGAGTTAAAGATLCSSATACVFSGSNYSAGATPVFGSVPTSCNGVTPTTNCTPVQIAALDMSTWMANMYQQVPGYSASINCNSASPTVCTIKITWTEKATGMNNTTASEAATANTTPTTQSYYLYVQP